MPYDHKATAEFDYRLGYVRVANYQGLAIVLPGHGHAAETIERIAADEFPEEEIRTEEVHWWVQRRVKNCGLYGDPCDSEGDWHTHWHAVKPTDDPTCHFTVIWGDDR